MQMQMYKFQISHFKQSLMHYYVLILLLHIFVVSFNLLLEMHETYVD